MVAPAAPPAVRFASPYLLLTLTPFFWACNWIVGRGLHAEIPPMTMTFYRWFFALLILAPFAWRHVRREWPIVRRHRGVLLLLGIAGVGTHNALTYLGLNYTTAINGVILNSFIPVMIIALSWIFLRQSLSRLQLIGVAVSLGGVLAILSGGNLEALASLSLNRGDLLIIVAMSLWSIYTIGLRWRPPGLHMLTSGKFSGIAAWSRLARALPGCSCISCRSSARSWRGSCSESGYCPSTSWALR